MTLTDWMTNWCWGSREHSVSSRLKVQKLRLLQGMEAKAKRGELIRVLAPGYVCDLAGQIVKDPNLRVQDAFALVFKKFRGAQQYPPDLSMVPRGQHRVARQ